MDPRAKVRSFSKALVVLSNLTVTDYSSYLTEVRAQLSSMFNKYDEKFGAVRMQRPSQPVSSGKKKTAWGKIFGDDGAGSIGAGSSSFGNSSPTPSSLSRRTSGSTLLQAATSGASLGITFELSSTWTVTLSIGLMHDFNILNWWQEHKHTYQFFQS